MRILVSSRRRIYWVVTATLVLVIWYNLSTSSHDNWQFPVLKKVFVDGGAHILYGPFVSSSHGDAKSNHSVTLATHTSLKNLYYLQVINLVWKSPISVAVWAHGDLTDLVELVYILTQSCAGKQSLAFSILVPADLPHHIDVSHLDWQQIRSPNSHTCSQRSIHNRLYSLRALEPNQNYNSKGVAYPNNRLRNLALNLVKTSHVFVSDIDLMPSVDMDQQFMRFLHDSATYERSDAVFVVPVFESTHSQSNQWTVPRLIDDWQNAKVRQFYVETCPQCQGASQYANWIDRQTREDLTMTASLLPYVPGWEPFIITRTSLHPKYDSRFKQFGYNRMSVICELYMSGRRFYILDKVFVVHDGFKIEEGFHADKDVELKSNERLYKQFISELAIKYDTKRRC